MALSYFLLEGHGQAHVFTDSFLIAHFLSASGRGMICPVGTQKLHFYLATSSRMASCHAAAAFSVTRVSKIKILSHSRRMEEGGKQNEMENEEQHSRADISCFNKVKYI
jgi:hypothetical protein